MEVAIVNITPEMAKRMLEKNPYNRNISKRTVETYAEAMRRNEWHSNGESICFDEDGNLINGQHRLAACVLANVPFCSTVVTGVLKQDSYIYDKGRNRTIRNTVMIAQKHGEMDSAPIYSSNQIIATARYILSIQMGRKKEGDPEFFDNKRYDHLTTAEGVYGYIRSHSEGLTWVYERTNRLKRGIRKAAVLAALLQAYESGYPADKLDAVCECLATGIMAYPEDALVVKFREKFGISTTDSARSRKEQYMCLQKVLFDYEHGKKAARISASKIEYYKGAYTNEN